MENKLKRKLLIINNIGSPNSYQTKDVRRYLREFLMDPLVIQIPWIFRFLLVYVIISVFRASKSAAKYQSIWLKKGSPLIVYTEKFIQKLHILLPDFDIKMGMRYQNPSISLALKDLKNIDTIYFAPMYPQFAESTTKSAVQKFQQDLNTALKPLNKQVQVKIINPFWNHPGFIESWVQQIGRSGFNLNDYDVLLLSYHGLPEAQLEKNTFCQFNSSCCLSKEKAMAGCYRAQCFQTSQLIEAQLHQQTSLLARPEKLQIITTFQSRLGKAKWIEPFTDKTLISLAKNPKTKRVLIACPAFTTDCLETLEEIHVENRNEFLQQGGTKLDVVPCLNDSDTWIEVFANIIKNL